MKAFIIGLVAALVASTTAFAQGDHYVKGYTRSNGTYVAPHYQTNPNSTTSDNYSTVGNVNPYTGAPGTKPDTRPSYGYTPPAPSYTPPTYTSPYTSLPASTGIYSPYGSTPKKTCSGMYC